MTQDVELLPNFPQARIGQTQLSWRGCAHGLTCSHYADKPDATFVSLRMLIWPVTSHRYS
jgi:hypothetical protein